jgi:GNAT superfamily N-acetyltransferase
MEIRKYSQQDHDALFELLRSEGDDWVCYWGEAAASVYQKALTNSITYVAYEGNILCGYSRSLNDCDLYIYVCDLLVNRRWRGREIGRQLMEQVFLDYPNQTVYVMSDVDEYYQKLGYHKEGSVFEVFVK